VHIGDQRLAWGRLDWVYYKNRPLREKSGSGASEKKSDGDAENRHQGQIEKRGRDGVARLRRTETLVIGNYYAAPHSGCKGAGVATEAKRESEKGQQHGVLGKGVSLIHENTSLKLQFGKSGDRQDGSRSRRT
jgi:hypothetical protein